MIHPYDFLAQLSRAGVDFFAGVPDSLLQGLTAAIERRHHSQHFITANEGAAIGLAAGYHLATGNIPMVYLQNSGLGNAINPLTSLTDKSVYGIPVLLVIGWRGEPGIKDEPQHKVMGKITPTLLHQLNVPFIVLKKNDDHEWVEAVQEAITLCKQESRPVALLVESGVFGSEVQDHANNYELSTEEAITIVYDSLQEDDIVFCTTGKIGRAFYKVNAERRKISRYFLNVGSMGHAISIATGLALQVPQRVVVMDGDGSLLMHMGALALPPSLRLTNFVYLLLNNGAHASVGGQPTLGFAVDFCTIAKGCGFLNTTRIDNRQSLDSLALPRGEMCFVEIRTTADSCSNLPRPSETPKEAKEVFMNAIRGANPS